MRRPVRRLRVAWAAALATLLLPTPAQAATRVVTRHDVLTAAATYASGRGFTIGIAVVDTRTGEIDYGGRSNAEFASASVIKTLIAARLLATGQLHGTTEALAYRMITQSDNDAADQLYPLAGGDGLIPWTEQHFHVPDLGDPPPQPGAWGYSLLRPRGLVRFYAAVKADHTVGPWLLNAMHHIREYSSAGEYQWWGLPSATTHPAVKQGWNTDFGDSDVNTTGFVNGDRYAVAIMTRGPGSDYDAASTAMITKVARLLLPGGHYPDPVPTIRRLARLQGATKGGFPVTVHGAAFTHVTAVYFGTKRAARFHVVMPGTLVVPAAPAHAAGHVQVRVATTHGESRRSATSTFTYAKPAATR